MSRVPTVRKADLDRVLKALAKAGQAVGAIEVRPGGTVVITPAAAGVAEPPALTLAAGDGKPTDLDGWREQKKQRGGRAS